VSLGVVSRDVISDEAWAVIGPLFPAAKATGRPPVDRRTVVEATAWRFRTGAPWRDLPERFGNWSTIYKNFGEQRRTRYRGRNVVERCFNKLKQRRGIAMRSDMTARNHHAGICPPPPSTGSTAGSATRPGA
jgi:transposase